MNKSIAILGIHTGIGKTIASAVIAEAIGADYWKPVQAGLEERDAVLVTQLLTNGKERVHEEAIKLTRPMSPHAAAKAEGIEIDYTKFKWPETNKTLLVETAGGILSPMSSITTMADFVSHYQLPVILITQNYLGSINHTLLSIEVLRSRGIKLLGVIVNGITNESSESFIKQYAQLPIMTSIPYLDMLNNDSIVKAAAQIKPSLYNLLNNGDY